MLLIGDVCANRYQATERKCCCPATDHYVPLVLAQHVCRHKFIIRLYSRKSRLALMQLWSAAAVIRNGRRFRGKDVSFLFSTASLHASLVGMTKTQWKDTSARNLDAIEANWDAFIGSNMTAVQQFLVIKKNTMNLLCCLITCKN